MFNVRVEYESIPIRHIAVQCPECKRWFCGWDIVKGERKFDVLRYAHDISFVDFECPVCGKEFGWTENSDNPNIKECGYSEVYKDCLQRKETWE